MRIFRPGLCFSYVLVVIFRDWEGRGGVRMFSIFLYVSPLISGFGLEKTQLNTF